MDQLAELYTRHHADVRRFALFLTGDAAEADDLTSETFVRAWAARDSIAATSVRAYLLTITRNLYRDAFRRRRRLVPLDDVLADRMAAPSRADDRWPLVHADRTLRHAPAGDRRALLLHAIAGLSYAEVAARLGITLGAVKSRIFRARAVLTSVTPRQKTGVSK